MTKTKPMTDEWAIKTMLEMGYGLLTDGKTFYKNGYELDPRGNITYSMTQAYEISQAIDQATSKAREEERNKLRQSVELWMDTHERNQTTFKTNEFIKFVIGGVLFHS